MKGAFLLDTSVVSLIAPDRPVLPESFAGWLRARDKLLFLSAVTVLEIEHGVRKLRRAGAPSGRIVSRFGWAFCFRLSVTVFCQWMRTSHRRLGLLPMPPSLSAGILAW